MNLSSGTPGWPRSPRWVLLALPALLQLGCDQVGDVVDDVKASVGESSSETEPTAGASESPNDSISPVSTQKSTATADVDPEELVRSFRALSGDQVTDAQLHQLLSVPEAAAQIERIETSSSDFTAAGIKRLAELENLKSVTIVNPQLSPADLSALTKVTPLQQLALVATQTDDSVVAALSALPYLETLDLSATRITGGSANRFAAMTALRNVTLQSTLIDDSVATQLATLPLTSVNLARTRITNASVAPLLQIDSLEQLNVSSTPVTGDAFAGINRTGIRMLNVSDTAFGIEGFAQLKNMKQLTELHVHAAGMVEHRRVDVFRTLPQLTILRAGANSISDEGMDVFFKGHRSLEELFLNENRAITDRGLSALTGVRTLRKLSLHGTRCTPLGVQQLQQRLPDCEILL